MNAPFSPPRFSALCATVLVALVLLPSLGAQPTNDVPAPNPDELSQAALLKANLHLQEQLHAAQLAIERNRIESQEAARAQADVVMDKLKDIQSALDTERQRQQDEMQRANRTLLWVASAFGGVGLLAMFLTALFQWRAMNRMSELPALPPHLPGPASTGLLPAPGTIPARTSDLSNQRLMSVIDRLERRIFELEHTAARPLQPPSAITVDADSAPAGGNPESASARTVALLGKGQALLNADKAAEALACYDEILKLDENHPEALVKKGAALERLKQDDEALRCYDRAIAADGSLTIAYLYKGGVFNRLERYNEALECYEQALRAQGGGA